MSGVFSEGFPARTFVVLHHVGPGSRETLVGLSAQKEGVGGGQLVELELLLFFATDGDSQLGSSITPSSDTNSDTITFLTAASFVRSCISSPSIRLSSMILRGRVERYPPKGRSGGRVLRGPPDTCSASFAGLRRARLPRTRPLGNTVNKGEWLLR